MTLSSHLAGDTSAPSGIQGQADHTDAGRRGRRLPHLRLHDGLEDLLRDRNGPGRVGGLAVLLRLALHEPDLRAADKEVEDTAMKMSQRCI